MKRRSTSLDRLMIIGVLCLVAWPLLYWLFSPLEWQYARALEEHRQGNLEQAQIAYKRILNSNPSHPLALFRLGELAYENERFEESAELAERALEFARAPQKPHIINLQTNSYVALGNREKAIRSVLQLQSFSTLPANYAKLPKEELIQLMSQPGNRHFLNSLAYVAAVANDDLQQGYRFINVVIEYFETKERISQMAIPYLYERTSEYSLAEDSLVQLSNRIKNRISNRIGVEFRIAELKSKLQQDTPDDSIKDQLKNLEKIAHHDLLFIVFTRLKLLSTKLDSKNKESISQELDSYRSEFINQNTTKLELDDPKFVEYAFELQHYYDTRAFITLRMGQELVSKSMSQKENFSKFLQVMEVANGLYRNANADLTYAIELKKAMNKYLAKFPNNSLAITLPSDDRSKVVREKRVKAIEHYHRYLILNALGKIEDAEIYRSKIVELGYEPSPLLF